MPDSAEEAESHLVSTRVRQRAMEHVAYRQNTQNDDEHLSACVPLCAHLGTTDLARADTGGELLFS